MKSLTYVRLALPCVLVASVACGSSRHPDTSADAASDAPADDNATVSSGTLDGGKASTSLDASFVAISKSDAGHTGDGASEVVGSGGSDGGVETGKTDSAEMCGPSP